MPLDPITFGLLTSLGSTIAVEGVRVSVRGTIDGYKNAKKESVHLFLNLVRFFITIIGPIFYVTIGRERQINPYVYRMNPLSYLEQFVKISKLNFNRESDRKVFQKMLDNTDPLIVAQAVSMASLAFYPAKAAVFSKNIVVGVVDEASNSIRRFFKRRKK